MVSAPPKNERKSRSRVQPVLHSLLMTMMIAFIAIHSGLVPLIEGLCAQILYFRFEIISGLRSLLLLLVEKCSNCFWNSLLLLLVKPNILCDFWTCVSSLPSVRTDTCGGRPKLVGDRSLSKIFKNFNNASLRVAYPWEEASFWGPEGRIWPDDFPKKIFHGGPY